MRALPLLLLLAACDEPALEDFDASCDEPIDCQVVVDVGFCGACDSLGALHIDDASRFENAQDAYDRVNVCGSYLLIGCNPEPVDPSLARATCDAGTCGFVMEEDLE